MTKPALGDITRQKFIGTSELADAAARLVARLVPAQHRGSVSDLPDERTVRYYLTQSLLSEPEGRQGTASVYGYRHLLELLAVKRLQAENLRIRDIRERMSGKSIADLERLVESPQTEADDALLPAGEESAAGYLESLLADASDEGEDRKSGTLSLSSGMLAVSAVEWLRVEIEPGLELHIRADWQPPADAQSRRRLERRLSATVRTACVSGRSGSTR